MDRKELFRDMPLGLAMSLGLHEYAMDYFTNLDDTTKSKIKNYIQTSSDGKEVKKRIHTIINNLENHKLDFLN